MQSHQSFYRAKRAPRLASLVGGLCAVLGVGCASEGDAEQGQSSVAPGQSEPPETLAIRNGDPVGTSLGSGTLHIQTTTGMCTASMINENTLITAAHCIGHAFSDTDGVQVLAQEDPTTWRCLTGTLPTGAYLRGGYPQMRNACPSIAAYALPNPDTDFAVIRFEQPGFHFVGVVGDSFTPIMESDPPAGFDQYGFGRFATDRPRDGQLRHAHYDAIVYDLTPLTQGESGRKLFSAYSTHGETCSGDSGGPAGQWVTAEDGSWRFAVRGVTADWNLSLTSTEDATCVLPGLGMPIWARVVRDDIERTIGKRCRRANYNGTWVHECWGDLEPYQIIW